MKKLLIILMRLRCMAFDGNRSKLFERGQYRDINIEDISIIEVKSVYFRTRSISSISNTSTMCIF